MTLNKRDWTRRRAGQPDWVVTHQERKGCRSLFLLWKGQNGKNQEWKCDETRKTYIIAGPAVSRSHYPARIITRRVLDKSRIRWKALGNSRRCTSTWRVVPSVLRWEIIVGYMLKISGHMIPTCVQVALGQLACGVRWRDMYETALKNLDWFFIKKML